MRKLFYAVALLLVSANMNAQSYFVDGYNTSFDSWVDIKDADENVIGVRPAGWYLLQTITGLRVAIR